NRLKEHEVSLEHLNNMANWFEMRRRLKKNETIDKLEQKQFENERDHWKNVIIRIICIVKFLAKPNLAFRGSNERLHQDNNEFFWGLIEMLEVFDPFIKEHVRRITSEEIHVHYLGHNIQNELIQLLAGEIRSTIIKRIKQAKYFSLILDCTPDTSHQEQMSLILRYVNISSTCVSVEESFLGFLNVDDTTSQELFDVTQAELKALDLDIDDEFRVNGFSNAVNVAKKISLEMDINPLFIKKCGIRRKRHFHEAFVEEDVMLSAKESLKLYDDDRLKSCCSRLESALKNGDLYYINVNELYVELRSLNNYFPTENMRPVDVLKILKQDYCYPNSIIAYRVLLTIPVIVASAERSFSRLKLIKSYLQSSMSQERLNGLALIAIENDMLESVDYEDLINNSASENVDTGATCHVCADKSKFHSCRVVDNGEKLYMGKSATADIKGEGDVILKMTSIKELKLTNVCMFWRGYAVNGMFKLNVMVVKNDINIVNSSSYLIESSNVWHGRLGHVDFNSMRRLIKYNSIPNFHIDPKYKCETCVEVKLTRSFFKTVKQKTEPLAMMHTDICDLKSLPTKGGNRYFITFNNDCTKKIKVVQSDRGGEYVSPLAELCVKRGIKHEFTTPYSPQQNACINGIKEYASFFENIFPCLMKETGSSSRLDEEVFQDKRQRDINDLHDERQDQLEEEEVAPRRSKRARTEKSFGPDFVSFMVENEPTSYREADLPPGCKPLGYKCIFKKKMKADGTIEKYKARLVIKGFRQHKVLDYFDTYSPVTRITSIRMILPIVALRNLKVHQMDVKTAFLNGYLEEEIYMNQPESFIAPGQEGK
nr:zinc finger MYM-type protein 1-like [Tanacetum cinerariifolium]